MRVSVHFNLHTDLWSVIAREGPQRGRVIAHREGTALDNPVWRVSEATRQRTLRLHKRTVHAWLFGDWTDETPTDTERSNGAYVSVTYNPYRGPHLTRRDTGEPVETARRALFIGGDCAVLIKENNS